MATPREEKDWKELLDTVHEMSDILNTGLDKQALAILVNLCQAGVNPEALAMVVKELRKDAARPAQPETDPQVNGSGATAGTN